VDGRQPGSYPETGLGEINGNVLEADFWPVDGFNIQVKTFFLKTDYSTFARQNEAARAADATACMDSSVGTVLLKNGWGRR
jgi:hypothetical protein